MVSRVVPGPSCERTYVLRSKCGGEGEKEQGDGASYWGGDACERQRASTREDRKSADKIERVPISLDKNAARAYPCTRAQ